MSIKILAELDFQGILGESMAQTQTGAEIISKYQSYLLVNEANCALVNSFVKEASNHTYDNGVHHTLVKVTDFISENKASWALASACESINNDNSSHNYIKRNAAKQVAKLLEMDETNVVKYVKNGALKNVMFCEEFRNIAKQIFKETPMVEAAADYVVTHPVSFVESVGDGLCFSVMGKLYKVDDDKNITEGNWSEVSNTFRTITSILESANTTIDNHTISIKAGNATYEISENDGEVKIVREGKEMNVTQLREHNRLVLMTTNPRHRNQFAALLEGIALIAENYGKIANMDTVGIYETKNDKFLVIEGSDKLYATLLASRRHPAWTVNENAMDALTFIKAKTNVSLSECYRDMVKNQIEKVSEQEQENIMQELHEQKVQSIRERIEQLTEKFKNDPAKLAVLSKCAQDLGSAE